MAAGTPDLGLSRRLARRLLPVVLLVGCVVAAGLPATYYVLQLRALERAAAIHAEEVANRLHDVILEEPDLWRYQAVKYLDLLHHTSREGLLGARIIDLAGRPVPSLAWAAPGDPGWRGGPRAVGRAPLRLNNRRLGDVAVIAYDVTLLPAVGGLAVLSSITGLTIAFLAYVTPLRIVRHMERRIVALLEANETAREYAEAVHHSGESLLTVIDDILDFSKMEAGHLQLEPVPVAFRDTVAATLKSVALLAHQKGLDLAYDVAPAVPDTLVVDPGRLRQVLLNLVGNAIKFTERGEVAVLVDLESEDAEGIVLHAAVRDTGIGIPADKQAQILEPFIQADTSITRQYGGTGLGLAIARRLVELMGGRLWLSSAPGHGSTFHFTVRARQGAGRVPSRPAPDVALLRGLEVLVVDDNATNRQLLGTLLASWGMVTAAAASGIEALAALEGARAAGRPFQLALLDGRMPGMDGFAVAARIRETPGLTALPIMLLTSAARRDDFARCQALGISLYLVKPIAPSELLTALLEAVGSRAPRTTAGSSPGDRAAGGAALIGRPLRVLVAEDNAVNRTVITRMLEKLGHTVVLAASGREALTALDGEAFDLALMDVQMPEMDGLTATAAIRRHEAERGAPHLPIIALTAYALEGDRQRCLAAGMDDHLAKPIRREELARVLGRVTTGGPHPSGP